MNSKQFRILSLLAVSVLLFGFTFADKTPPTKDAYNLKLKINGLKTGDTIYLANYYGDKQYLKDTALVGANGSFSFTGKEKLPRGIYLVVLPGKQYFEVIITDEQNFLMETDNKDYTKNMKVTGSTENIAFYDYLKYVVVKGTKGEELKKLMDSSKVDTEKKTYRDQLISIEKGIFEYRKDFIAKNPDKFVSKVFKSMSDPEVPAPPTLPNGRPDSTFPYRYYKAHYWDNIDLNDDGLIRSPIFHGKLDRYIKQMVLQMPDSINKEADYLISKVKDKKGEIFKYIIWYITNQYETSNIMGMDAVFVHMAEKYYLTGQAYWVNEETENKIRDRYAVLRNVLLGSFAPVLSLPDTSGKTKAFTSIKAKYTVLIFWAPSCGHCQKELPKLRDIYKKTKDKYSVEVYSVNTEADEKAWKDFVKNNNLGWINVWDPNHTTGFQKTYDVYSTPTMYILDESKKIIAKRLGVEQLEDFFENYSKIKKIN
jgi:peroxiredoxin